ncbi:MAG: MATE family efflux transporter [Deltaproteobacteria bacterium]|nr:MATE family efflux transporter [Deltaproteobacteria bacterium]
MQTHESEAQPLAAGVGAAAKPQGMWSLMKEAVAGSRRDFTTEDLGRAVILLAVPMVLEMVMESIFAVVDIFWVSKLGPEAVASVGLTESLLNLLYALAIGLSMGAAAVVSRRIGEKDPEGAARAAFQAILLGGGLSVVIGVGGAVAAPQLLQLMGASAETTRVGVNYTRVMLGGSATVVMLFLINAIFRGAGDAAVAMRTLWLANGINIVLGPFLVFGWGPFPKWGVAGAAVATTIGRGTGVLYQLYKLTRPTSRVALKRRHLIFEADVMKTIIRIARSGVFQVLVGSASWIALVRVLANFGSTAVAGYTIAIRVVLFALLPSWGMANAAATLVGQNLGAKQPDRAEQAVWRAAIYNLYFLGTVGVIFFIFAGNIAALFAPDPEVVAYATRCLRIVSAGFLFYAVGMVVTQAFNGAGDTKTPTWINIICFWLWEIPLAYALSHFTKLGPTGVFTAIMTAFSLVAVLSVVLFKRGTWKVIRV